ncbi:fumarylacetoacetate hydrolase family protein [Rhodococcus pseudokoreensis]|uniref:Fumarylacetoacetate hydrolase family protein n=1 Tax=Rhodococcus pseudokoreensis TaxID=2811421 RepID=A0A974WAI8_9NOCA|nr:fumarylacetoacetate hydrolase family protein [Rhodococcus pseudokoreensis]QSE93752.1 fumarylacetoacetate hydrolase family protein [Rhodococcus pseudokoreensis]
MQLARIKATAGVDFAVRGKNDEPWTCLTDLGMDVSRTAEAISRWSDIDEAYTRSVGAGVTDPELLCPVVSPSKIVAIGLNYMDHIRETNSPVPEQPVVFAKYPSSLNSPRGPILVDPHLTEQVDYEVELAVVIGTEARRLTRDNALDCVFGYAIANDVSARDLQRRDSQLSRSKGFDTFCPIGPWITVADSAGSPQDLRISSWVNGETRQDSSTDQMLFTVADLLVHLSASMTLEAGDVILTGTPPGVGVGHEPPMFLKDGDVVRCEIAGLGELRNTIRTDPGARLPETVLRQSI